MELNVKHYSQLSKDELYEIYKARVAVFVVEQSCPYQEVDDFDRVAYHLWLSDDDGIQAYARVLPKGTKFAEVSLGRVLTLKRRQGLGLRIVREAIKVACTRLDASAITIEAQVYARSLYEKEGFVQISDEFLDDGIPHIKMQLVVQQSF